MKIETTKQCFNDFTSICWCWNGIIWKEQTCIHPVSCFWLVRNGSSVSPSMTRSQPSSITTLLQRTPPPLNTQTLLLPGPSASPLLLGKCVSVSGIVWRPMWPQCSLHLLLPKLCHLFFSLASKVRDEPLKSDFTIDLKHEVRRVLSLRSILCGRWWYMYLGCLTSCLSYPGKANLQ